MHVGDVPHTIGKLSMRFKLCFRPHLNRRFAHKVMRLQSHGSPNFGNFETPKSRESQFWEFWDSHLGVLGKNDIWVLVPWPGTKYTIRGKVVVSPKSESWWVLWVCVAQGSSLHQKCYNYALTNLLFGLCMSMWVIKLLFNIPSPIP